MGESRVEACDSKIKELEADRANLEHSLMKDRELLRTALANEALKESGAAESVKRLRESIGKQELRLADIESTITGLRARRVEEVKKAKGIKIEALTKELKVVDLVMYKTYLEQFKHTKVVHYVDKAILEFQNKRDGLVLALNQEDNMGRVNIFEAQGAWFSDPIHAATGMQPWQDFEGLQGEEFMKSEIARLEKEIGK